jgi:type I restriction enzyme M protein
MKQELLFSEIEILPLSGDEPVKIIHEIRNYLAGQAHGITRDSALLEEVIKIYFCIRFGNIQKKYSDSVDLSKDIRNQFKEIKKMFPELYSVDEEILIDPYSVNFVYEALNKLEKTTKRKVDILSHLYEIFVGEDIKGKEGQFFTPKVAVDFLVDAVGPKSNWKIADTACGACSFLTASVLYMSRSESPDVIKKLKLTGIEKDQRLVRLAKIHLALMTGNTKIDVRCEDSLKEFEENIFDLIVTNPPFGSKIIAANSDTLKKYELSHKWIVDKKTNEYIKTSDISANTPPQVLFMERNIKALKANGILATVVPESLISSKNYKYVVNYLLQSCDLLAVFGMPESLFKISGKGGTHTKTSLLILKKKKQFSAKQKNKIFMAEALWCGHDSRGNTIPKNDLPEMLLNYRKFLEGKDFEASQKGYLLSVDDIDDLTLAPRFYDLDFKRQFDKIQSNCKLLTIQDLINDGVLKISNGDEVGKLAYGGGDIPYVRTSDISNWEVKEGVKQKVSSDVYESLQKKQDVQEGDILLVKDGTYLIGTLGIITSHDTQIVYQSHIYKLRVLKNSLALNPFNLLALLSSNFVQKQIRNKVLTQDVIDSLGRRIYDISLPIPSSKELSKIAEKVESIIEMKAASKANLRSLEVDNYFS